MSHLRSLLNSIACTSTILPVLPKLECTIRTCLSHSVAIVGQPQLLFKGNKAPQVRHYFSIRNTLYPNLYHLVILIICHSERSEESTAFLPDNNLSISIILKIQSIYLQLQMQIVSKKRAVSHGGYVCSIKIILCSKLVLSAKLYR